MSNAAKIFLIFLLTLIFVFPAFAQEVTPESTPIVEPSPEPPTDAVSFPSWAVANGAVVLVALAGIFTIVNRWLEHRNLKTALEQVEKSRKDAIEAAIKVVPPEVMEPFRDALRLVDDLSKQVQALLDFVDEVTDGEENVGPVQ